MITIYNANSSIDAKLIQDQLSFADIPSHIMGDLLQGGVGELQPQGLVKVMVDEEDFEKAKEVIVEWEGKLKTNEKPNHLKQKMIKSSSSKILALIYVPIFIVGLYILFTVIRYWFIR